MPESPYLTCIFLLSSLKAGLFSCAINLNPTTILLKLVIFYNAVFLNIFIVLFCTSGVSLPLPSPHKLYPVSLCLVPP